MSEVRIIKKYPNRRLYDTTTSEYITLADVKRLVLAKVSVKIIDSRSEKDVTYNSLLQIFFEQEENGTPILTAEILENMIRAYDNSMQMVMRYVFEKGMQYLLTQQADWQHQWEQLIGTPMSTWMEFTERNVSFWREWQQQVFNSASNTNEEQDHKR